jgi:hypothetical protein
MNIRVWFNKIVKVKEIEEDLNTISSSSNYNIGAYYVDIDDFNWQLRDFPKEFESLIKEIEVYDCIESEDQKKLIIGQYAIDNTKANLDSYLCGGKIGYRIKIVGKNLRDIRTLYYQIRSGKSKPIFNFSEGPNEADKL